MSNYQNPISDHSLSPSGIRTSLQFLKLGGSLITDKSTSRTPRLEIISRLANEIAEALASNPKIQLVLGHGSGSFGHIPAKKYGTRQGVVSSEEWLGFAKVWHEASALNHIVIEALHAASLPAVAFPPSGAVTASGGLVTHWNLDPLCSALERGLLPVVYGDVVFDKSLGGTILSTEDIFSHLAKSLPPKRILLAGLDEGVWEDYPQCTQLIPEINTQNWTTIAHTLGGSQATDVTGGMASKVSGMLKLTREINELQVFIFSGLEYGNVLEALSYKNLGTRITTS